MPLIEKRYAEALVEISLQDNMIESYQKKLTQVVSILNENDDFERIILNPQINMDIKKSILKEVFKNIAIDENLMSFLMLLLDKGRFNLLPGILQQYIKLSDKKTNTLTMKISSGLPLDEEQIYRIKEKYRSLYNASSVKAEIEIDKKLIGGVRVSIADKVFDATIKSRLDSLKDIISGIHE